MRGALIAEVASILSASVTMGQPAEARSYYYYIARHPNGKIMAEPRS